MARQQIRGEQVQTQSIKPRQFEGIQGPFKIVFKGPTTARQNVSTTWTDVSGATGDTTYTAPADQNMRLLLIMTQMLYTSSGSYYVACGISINGTLVNPRTYQNRAGQWGIQTIHKVWDVDAGETITIGARIYCNTSGTGWITNGSGDTQYPNDIIYTAYPRSA